MIPANAFYLILYCATLGVHVVFMNYVLGGTVYLAAASLRNRRGGDVDPIVETARDWMPFVLSAAITAGVAPLLFIQLLHQRAFYTANLLLFHRWMSIIPVLIVGFYLLYLLKSRPWSHPVRLWAAIGALLCIVWTGLSWTENHVLSLDAQRWPAFFEAGSLWYRDVRVGARFGVWVCGSLPVFAMLMAWQLHMAAARGGAPSGSTVRGLAGVAMLGLSLCVIAGGVYGLRLEESARAGLWRQPYSIVLTGAGILAQGMAWQQLRGRGRVSSRALFVLTAASLLTIAGATWARETIRLTAASPRAGAAQLDHIASVGGFWVFAAFLIVNGLAVAWCIRISLRRTSGAAGRPV